MLEFGKDFFKLINDANSGKSMENLRNIRYVKFVTIKARKNYLVSEPNYYTKNFFLETY